MDRFTAPERVASVKCSHCAHIEASQVLRTKMDTRKLTTSQEQFDVHGIEVGISYMKELQRISSSSGSYLFELV